MKTVVLYNIISFIIEYGKKSKGKPRYHFEALEKQQDV